MVDWARPSLFQSLTLFVSQTVACKPTQGNKQTIVGLVRPGVGLGAFISGLLLIIILLQFNLSMSFR